MILLACAVEKELAGWPSHDGFDQVFTGVGPIEAACAVTAALARKPYDVVINAGICGALEATIPVGSSVVVARERFELDREDGSPLDLPDGMQKAQAARSDMALVERLRRKGFPVVEGITVARVTSTEETAQRLARLGAQVESMEGFAVLRAAELANVRAIELRGVSNRAGSRERSAWDFGAGATALRALLDAFAALLDQRDSVRP